MIKKVTLLRFFGDSNINFNINTTTSTIYHKLDENLPTYLTSSMLLTGEIFEDFLPIIQLGILTLPGVKFNLNDNLDPIIVGSSGIYELDLTDSSAKIVNMTIDQKSLNLINESPDGYLIIDLVYLEE